MFARLTRFLLTLVFFSALAGILGAVWLLSVGRNPGPLSAPRLVVLEPKTGTRGILDVLSAQGVVTHETAFLLTLAVSGKWGELKAGEYEFPAHAAIHDIIDQLAAGRVYQRHVTIPEGVTVYQALHLLDQAEGLTGTVTTIPEEGHLLPETYAYTRGMSRETILLRMVGDMDKFVTALWTKRPAEFPLKDVNQVLTLASIIERETGVPDERPKIASVFFNRLQTGMRLQSDPTVIYALTKGQGRLDRPLLTKDLTDTQSLYNTYITAGLPPGPIANPSKASIEAVFKPAQTDYFYFVADGRGGHVFAHSLEEHNKNVAAWRQAQVTARNAAATTPVSTPTPASASASALTPASASTVPVSAPALPPTSTSISAGE